MEDQNSLLMEGSNSIISWTQINSHLDLDLKSIWCPYWFQWMFNTSTNWRNPTIKIISIRGWKPIPNPTMFFSPPSCWRKCYTFVSRSFTSSPYLLGDLKKRNSGFSPLVYIWSECSREMMTFLFCSHVQCGRLGITSLLWASCFCSQFCHLKNEEFPDSKLFSFPDCAEP